MFGQGKETRRFSTMRVHRPAEEKTRCFDDVLDDQTQPQQGLVINPG